MKAMRVSLVVLAAAFGAPRSSFAQTDVAWRLETGLGGEHLNSSTFHDPTVRLFESAAGEVSFAPRGSSLTYLLGFQGERHALTGGGDACLESVRAAGYAAPQCYASLPDFVGARLTVGARYEFGPDLSVGLRLGAGYLSTSNPAYSQDDALTRAIQVEVAKNVSDHLTIAGRAEQMEMPDYGGAYVRARPVSLVLRFR